MKGRTLSSLAAVFIVASLAFAQTPVGYQQNNYPSPELMNAGLRVDLNGDGADDLVTAASARAGSKNGIFVYINNGDGTFRAPVNYFQGQNTGYVNLQTGDWNNDGKADVVLGTQNGATVFLGNGDGTLHALWTLPIYGPRLAIADINRDGKLDIVDGGFSVAYGDGKGMFGNPKSVGFTPPTQSSPTAVVVGDFDADGNADIFVSQSTYARDMTPTTYFTTLYGHGDGTFTKVSEVNHYNVADAAVADIDQDGKADLVLSIGFCNSCTPGAYVLYGSSARNFNRRKLIPATNNDDPKGVGAADVNGDGRQDIVTLSEGVSVGQSTLLISWLQNPDGSFTRENHIVGTQELFEDPIVMADFNRDRKPDVLTDRFTFSGGGVAPELVQLLNVTASSFPPCAPAAPQGINVCSPQAGSSVGSTVHFSIGAAALTPLRKLEVWIDGAKRLETFYSWANKSFMEKDLALAAGPHQATIFAAGFDSRLIKKSFTFTVGSGGGCSTPSSATATVICSPTNGSTVSSPVSVQAKGGSSVKNMEAWVDGVRKYAGTGNTVSLSLSLAAGSHKLTVFSKNGSTVLSSAVSNFTVK